MAISSKEWLAVLLTENGASYYVDDNGNVRISLIPKPLSNMFEGWADIVINYGRSAKYFGLDRTYNSSYKFVKDGATILRYLLYGGRSIESKVYLGLLKLNNVDNGNYELYYKAEIDLSQAVNDPDTGVTVEVMQDGPVKYIRANENIVYDLNCDELTVNLDGVRYSDTFNYFTGGVTRIDKNEQYIIPVNFVSNEGQNVNIKKGDSTLEQIFGDIETALLASDNYFFSTLATLSVEVSGTFTVQIEDSSAAFDLSFYVYPQTAPITQNKFTIASSLGDLPGVYTFTYNGTIPVSKNGKVFLFLNVPAIIGGPKVSLLETNFTVKFDSRFQKTTCFANRPMSVFNELISKISDGRYTGRSTLLDDNKHLVVTCGDAIRGIASPKIKTSFSDFCESYMFLLGGAVGVDFNTNEIVFERKEYFADNAIEIIDVGEVSELNIEIAKDYIVSSIKTGYADQKVEESVARQEVNAGQQYTTPITRIKKELNLISRYRTDIFGIERLRQQFYDLPNTDSKGDNSVFVINIERSEDAGGGWNVYRAPYSFITGGTNQDTWYNIEQLTPKRVLQANGSYIRGGMSALGNELIKFTSADKNAALITTLAGVSINEGGDVRINSLTDSFYQPFLIKFKAKISQNIVSLLQQTGRGYITGTWKGNRFYGFPQELSVKPVFDEAQELTLLASSLMSLSDFSNLNNQGIVIEDMGIISHKLPIKFLQVSASYPLQYHFKQMDSDWFKNRIDRYSNTKNYFQKWQTNDSFDVQFITQGLAASLTLIDCHGKLLDTITLTAIANPAITSPKQLFVGTVDCSMMTENEVCYLLATFGSGPTAKQFISEPMMAAEDWADTLLFEYTNDKNQTDIIWNVPFSTKIRVEGFIQRFKPGGRLSQFEDQPLDIVNLDGEATRSYELLIEEVPDWIIDKLNRILLLDSVTIDGVPYTLDKDAKFEAIETPGAPMASWSIAIREANNRAGIAIDADGNLSSPLTVEYDINTKGFSSNQSPANQQDTIIQITDIE